MAVNGGGVAIGGAADPGSTNLAVAGSIAAASAVLANITATASGGLQIGAPTGGDKGAGTLNLQNTLWMNGTQGVSTTCTVTATNTYVFTNGVLTSKGANCT
jgi:hypothetical protein